MCTVGLCGLGVVPIVTGSFLGGTSRPGCNESLAWFPVCLFVPSLGWSPSKLLPQALPCWGPWPGSASCPPSSHLLRCRKPDHTWHWGCTSRPGQRAPVRWLCRARLLVRRPPGHTAPRCGHTAAGASPDAAGGGASYFGGGVKPGRAGRRRFSPEKSQRAQPRSGGPVPLAGIPKATPSGEGRTGCLQGQARARQAAVFSGLSHWALPCPQKFLGTLCHVRGPSCGPREPRLPRPRAPG